MPEGSGETPSDQRVIMFHLTARIRAVGDPPSFPEYADATEADVVGFCVMEKGMASGAVSTAIIFKDSDGKYHEAPISSDMFLTMANIVRGAKERFRDFT